MQCTHNKNNKKNKFGKKKKNTSYAGGLQNQANFMDVQNFKNKYKHF